MGMSPKSLKKDMSATTLLMTGANTTMNRKTPKKNLDKSHRVSGRFDWK